MIGHCRDNPIQKQFKPRKIYLVRVRGDNVIRKKLTFHIQ